MGGVKRVRAAWRARPYERMTNEVEAWAVDDTTSEQGARLGALAASLRAAAQDLVETLGCES